MRTTVIRRAATLATLTIAVACGSSPDGQVAATADDLVHIHDLAVDDDTVLVASHTGLWRIEDLDRAVLVGAGRHDLMAMAQLGDGTLIASGHPDLRDDEFTVEGLPPFFGLATSNDGGRTWNADELLGHADFHAFAPADGDLYAAETAGRIWKRDSDGDWAELGSVEARDLATHPTDPNRLIATGYDGTVWTSGDGALTWSRPGDAPTLIEIEWTSPDEIIGAAEDGTIWTSSTPDSGWTESGSGPSGVETFYIDAEGNWWLATHGGAISTSSDEGASWANAYQPPPRA